MKLPLHQNSQNGKQEIIMNLLEFFRKYSPGVLRTAISSVIFGCTGRLGLILLLCVTGCKTGGGQDPLLGKTRLDPPTTNARSVYVERQNINESGVVPGGRPVASPSSQANSQSTSPAMAGTVQTVKYPDGLDEQNGSNSETENSVQDKKPALRWQSAEPTANTPKDSSQFGTNRESASTQNSDSEDLTPEELANYRYVYDFSVNPPRKVPVDRPYSPRKTTIEPASAPNSVSAPASVSVPAPQLVGQTFDPYAPNRQFERRRANLSRTLSAEFDSSESVPSATPYMNAEASPQSMRPNFQPEPVQTAKIQTPALNSGWRVVATPDPALDSLGTVAESQPAPINQAVGNAVNVPSPTSSPVQTGETKNSSRKKVSASHDEDSALNLLDLPER